MSSHRSCRPLRAGVFTLVCVNVSAHGHTWSSGHDVPLGGLLLGAALVLAMAWASADRRHGWWGLTLRMLWGQFALHVAFSYTQNLGEHHHAVGTVPADGTMVVSHVLTALIAAWWLRRGDNALHAFLRFMALRLLPPLLVLISHTPPAPGPNARFRPVDEYSRPRPSYLRHSRVLRGPPMARAA